MDIRHFYLEQGTGFPLILLHGNDDSGAYFANQLDAFAAKYRVYAPDTRGHGQTPRGSAPFTIHQFAEDLVGFMDLHGIEKAHVLGFSDGGNIAIDFALNHIDRVEKLILNGANLYPAGCTPDLQQWVEDAYQKALQNDPQGRGTEMLALMAVQPDFHPEELQKITVPTLVVAGTDDMILQEHTELIAASLPHSELHILPGDHFIASKSPEAFNRLVLTFLEK